MIQLIINSFLIHAAAMQQPLTQLGQQVLRRGILQDGRDFPHPQAPLTKVLRSKACPLKAIQVLYGGIVQLPRHMDGQRHQQHLAFHSAALVLALQPVEEDPLMGRMLINKQHFIVPLRHDICRKDLSDQSVIRFRFLRLFRFLSLCRRFQGLSHHRLTAVHGQGHRLMVLGFCFLHR